MPIIPIPAIAEPEWMPGWTRWYGLAELEVIPHRDSWGVYAIALKAEPTDDDAADPLDRDIQIIGETSGEGTSLYSRSYAARQVLKGRKASHGPAWTLRELIGIRPTLSGISIAWYPVWEQDNARSGALTLALERLFIFNFVHTHGRLPTANSE